MAKHKIHQQNFGSLKAKIEALSRKAEKLGLAPIRFEVVGSNLEENTDGTFHKVFHVEIEGQSPIIEGWQFVGKVEDTGNGSNLVKSFQELPEKFRNTDMLLCEHCHTRRNRKAVYILKSLLDGHYIQVGSTCLKDFGGHPDIMDMAKYAEELHALENEPESCIDDVMSEKGGETWIKLERFVAYTIQEVEQHGFVSKAKAGYGLLPTSSRVIDIMFPRSGNKKPEIDTSYIEKAKTMVFWIRGWDKTNYTDYEYNMMTICSEDYVKWDWLGYVASLIPLYNRENMVESKSGKFVGTIKKRETFGPLECIKIIAIDTMYGTTFLHKFNDSDGNLLVWFSSSVRLEEGKVYQGKATVKDHQAYNGENQTVLIRCKFDVME